MGVVAFGSVCPPDLPMSQKTAMRPNMLIKINRLFSFRTKFLSAGGMGREPLGRAAYGGGRDVLRGGMAKCIWGRGDGDGRGLVEL